MNEEALNCKQRLIQIAKESGMDWQDKSETEIMIDNYLFSFDTDGKLIYIDER